MNLPSAQPNLWTERYETLRRHFVENRPLLAADPLGLTLMFRKGMAGWMRTWRAGAQTAHQALTPNLESWCPPTSTVWQQELTQLIAHMTTPHL
jgi:hypothetical protein